MAKTVNVVAITEAMQEAGAIVWWRLSGDVPADTLRAAMVEAGFGEEQAPDNPTVPTALRRTLMELRNRDRLVIPRNNGKGWAVVAVKDEGDDDLAFDQELNVQVDAVGRLQMLPADHPLQGQIKNAFDANLEHLAPEDISTWLVGMAYEAQAVPLRDGGGIYFVPKTKLADWRKLVGVLRSISQHAVYEIPALRSDEAVSAILAAIEREAETEALAMEEALADDNLGPRALHGRASRCDAVEQKVAAYEELLGTKLDSLRGRLDKLRAKIAHAAMAAQAVAEEARAR